MTFTRDRDTAPMLAAPSAAYLAAMATGLREAHGWSRVQIDRYLSALPGVAPQLGGRPVGHDVRSASLCESHRRHSIRRAVGVFSRGR